ncbi:hypothetical protein GPDM_15961 [Planococcus donghaensis MPA1U2]|uniref:Uncharacterized protein n=1 Tax=Planococcus donghaensis MPA1U2 TaxID=933115 RepID=E7RL17_9BACL|nr:hypothetical protein [Planococcus donghaensis]EGA88295.1 hypothetical protein GPDM_15961 [Planococcus donghaensis MPA1U2]
MTGMVAIIMVFSIPLAAIITNHLQKQTKLKGQMISDELELEKLKHENFVLETQKMRLELEHMKLEDAHKTENLLLKKG